MSTLHIYPGQGGEDAALFASQLAHAVASFFGAQASQSGTSWDVESPNPDLKNVAGTHVVQRTPVTEKKGRRQTAYVYAVWGEEGNASGSWSESDVQLRPFKASGPGGQHRNKTETAIEARHVPTGITASATGSRSQHQNRTSALRVLEERVREHYETEAAANGTTVDDQSTWTWTEWRDEVKVDAAGGRRRASYSRALNGGLRKLVQS